MSQSLSICSETTSDQSGPGEGRITAWCAEHQGLAAGVSEDSETQQTSEAGSQTWSAEDQLSWHRMLQTHTWSIGLAAHPGGSVAADRELRSPRRRRHCCWPRGVEAKQK
ncbi:Antigen-Presenting Glycoprotein Cd1D [Manis pentadactyla]|nr:Antigen-Presenting Glycoprotein Cd1D [Manis pentadactyla]